MAQFEYKPTRQTINRSTPTTLRTVFEDGSFSIRQKHSNSLRAFQRSYTAVNADIKTQLDLLDGWGTATSFTILTWDPQAATPATDTATVYMLEFPSIEQVGGRPDHAEYTVVFQEKGP